MAKYPLKESLSHFPMGPVSSAPPPPHTHTLPFAGHSQLYLAAQ
jgi:hypothetical protein